MNKTKLHILVIPTWYPSGEDKLMGEYHREFTESLNKRNDAYANMIYVQRERLKKPLEYIKMPKWETIQENNYVTMKLHMLNINPINEIWQLNWYTKKMEKLFKKYVKKYGKPDVLHAQVTLPAGYAAAKIGNKYDIPVVTTEHGVFQRRFFKGKLEKYGNYVLDNTIFTTVSQDLENKLKPEVEKAERMPNSVDTSAYLNVKNKKKNKTIDLIQVCALRKAKRTDLIMDAMKILIEQGQKTNLTVVGDGFEANLFKDMCKEKNMEKHVTFVGQKNKQEIAEYFSKVDIAMIASDYETFAIPGVEALAAGIPVVSTKCGGPEEYLNSKCGELCEINNAESMAKAIKKVYDKLENYDIKYLKSVALRYDEKSVTDTAMKLYKKAMNKKNKDNK